MKNSKTTSTKFAPTSKTISKNSSKNSNSFVYLLLRGMAFSLMLGLILVFIGCQSNTAKRVGDRATVIQSDEGWVDNNTYRMWVIGSWDRGQYYIEGSEAQIDKEAKSIFVLRNLSKTAAKVQALRNFKERMLTYVESESRVENATLVQDEITASLNGVTIAPQAVEEEYSANGDANILYHFSAQGLKQSVDKAIQETVKRYREETSGT